MRFANLVLGSVVLFAGFSSAGCVVGDGSDEVLDEEETGEEPEVVTIESSSGCTYGGADWEGSECIEVNGTGVSINYVKSRYTHRAPTTVCTYHKLRVYTASGSLWLSQNSSTRCVKSEYSNGHVFTMNRKFPDNSKVCTTFNGTTACKGVHQ